MMSEKRYGVHDCPNGFYYLRDVTDHSVYIHRNYGYLYSPYQEDIELVSTLLNELADKVDEQQATIESLQTELELVSREKLFSRRELERKVKEQQATITELKEKLKLEQDFASRWQKESEMLAKENEQLRRDKNFLQNERRLQEKGIFTLFDEVNKLNKENENLKIDHRIMGEKLYIMSKDYIKDVGDDDEC